MHLCITLCTYIYSVCQFAPIADRKEHEGSGAAPAAPTVPQVRLNINQLVFHKVLGKGSFGKVSLAIPMFTLLKST